MLRQAMRGMPVVCPKCSRQFAVLAEAGEPPTSPGVSTSEGRLADPDAVQGKLAERDPEVQRRQAVFRRRLLRLAAAVAVLAAGALLVWLAVSTSRHHRFATTVTEAERLLSAGSWQDADAAFRRAQSVPGRCDESRVTRGIEAARRGTEMAAERKRQHDTALAEGDRLLAAGQWAGAEQAFGKACSVAGYENDARAVKGIEAAGAGAAAAAERKRQYETAIADGESLLKAERWTEAEAAFVRARVVPGDGGYARAAKGIEAARAGAVVQEWKRQYETAIGDGESLLKSERWRDSEAAFRLACSVSGYGEDAQAAKGIQAARAGAAAQERKRQYDAFTEAAHRAIVAGDWTTAEREIGKALEVDAKGADALAMAASLEPVLDVTAEVGGRETPGADIVINGIRQGSATPVTYKVKAGERYSIFVSLPSRLGFSYTTFESSVVVDWKGPRELRARIEARAAERRAEVGKPWTSPTSGMEFVWIAKMGMWIGMYEVTNAEYRRKEPAHNSDDQGSTGPNAERQPVVFVSFGDACGYALWLTQSDGATGCLPKGMRYRLPTQKEWETFAQCGDERVYPWGSSTEARAMYGNYAGMEAMGTYTMGGIRDGAYNYSDYRDGYVDSCPVEKSGRNDWGLFGVGGNVWELTAVDDTATSPAGLPRGGAYNTFKWKEMRCRDAPYFGYSALYGHPENGFRLILQP
jgi:formylglycine-generating enzyme required for sulfatase activity